jgi:hypothetical protein
MMNHKVEVTATNDLAGNERIPGAASSWSPASPSENHPEKLRRIRGA